MELYSKNDDYKLYQGNMLDMLEVVEPNSIDSIITDPPYELNFMNKGWDNSGIAFQKETWQKCYEVLKDGGYLLAFGGSRTFHRIACAIEDAGFEIRDIIMWLYGSGFPKSMDISKQIDKHLGIEREIIGKKEKRGGMKATFGGSEYKESALNITEPATDLAKQWQGWGTALKPSFEPIIVARKPFKGSLVDNVIEYGVGGINIDECRVGMQENDKEQYYKKQKSFENTNKKIGNIYGGNSLQKSSTTFYDTDTLVENTLNNGRFPANTILTYDESDFDEVCGGFPNTKAIKTKGTDNRQNIGNSMFLDGVRNENNSYNDSGSASRYFYCAKASKKDRDEGLDEFEDKEYILGCNGATLDNIREKGHYGNGGNGLSQIKIRKNTHPTVKPTDLMQYLVRLVTPNGGTILDPFNGSGSTGKAVMYENKERNKQYKYIGIELTEEYLPISKARIEYVCNLTQEELKEKQMTIFDLEVK